jgi:hypothetical protein
LDYTPYLPDLAPCDFWLFPKFKKKKPLMGWRFADIPDILYTMMLLWGIPENDFGDYFRQWYHCLTKCIASQGEYFEGDADASAQISKFCFHRAIPGSKQQRYLFMSNTTSRNNEYKQLIIKELLPIL